MNPICCEYIKHLYSSPKAVWQALLTSVSEGNYAVRLHDLFVYHIHPFNTTDKVTAFFDGL